MTETLSPASSAPVRGWRALLPDMNWQEVILLTWAAVALLLAHYHGHFSFLQARYDLFGWFALNVFLLLALPLLTIRFVFREKLADYGFCLGDVRLWGKYLLLFLAVFIPVAIIASRLPEFTRYYPRYIWARQNHWLLIPSAAGWLCYFAAWEFFFRGFLLFGLGKRLGPIAIFIQMVPFVMAHFPKPELESAAAIIAGVALGVMAWRSRSFVGTWLLHWVAATAMDILVVLWPIVR